MATGAARRSAAMSVVASRQPLQQPSPSLTMAVGITSSTVAKPLAEWSPG